MGLRSDKKASAVGAQREPVVAAAPRALHRLTSPGRVVFPQDGVTKAELARYYDGVQSVLWPQIRNRPLSIVRATEQGSTFFQRHLQSGEWPGLKALAVQRPDEFPYFRCSTPAGLQSLAQIAAVELHTWGSAATRPDRARRARLDGREAPAP